MRMQILNIIQSHLGSKTLRGLKAQDKLNNKITDEIIAYLKKIPAAPAVIKRDRYAVALVFEKHDDKNQRWVKTRLVVVSGINENEAIGRAVAEEWLSEGYKLLSWNYTHILETIKP